MDIRHGTDLVIRADLISFRRGIRWQIWLADLIDPNIMGLIYRARFCFNPDTIFTDNPSTRL